MTQGDPLDPLDPSDPYDLDRFVTAQDAGGLYVRALGELRAGRKTGHWMWFVFPQLAGLGASAMSRTYSIRSLAEASAYLKHPLLGARLAECATVLIELPESGRSAERIFGPVDALKLRSSMTLFGRAADADGIAFIQILDLYFEGQPDPLTEQALATGRGGVLPSECPPGAPGAPTAGKTGCPGGASSRRSARRFCWCSAGPAPPHYSRAGQGTTTGSGRP